MKVKKNLYRLLSTLFCCVMLVSLLPATAFAKGATIINVNNSAELSEAITRINDAPDNADKNMS